MTTDWIEQSEDSQTCYRTSCDNVAGSALNGAIENIVEKAVSMLHLTINDDSLYLLFEWAPDNAELSVVVTDAEKRNDSDKALHCDFTAELPDDFSEQLRYGIRDYFTTCSSFNHYSLVAIYHDSDRSKTVLL